MKITENPLHRFFINLFLVFLVSGCTSQQPVNPLEKESADKTLYFWGGMNGDEQIHLDLDPNRLLYRVKNQDETTKIIDELKTQLPQVNIEIKKIGSSNFLLVTRPNTFDTFPESSRVNYKIPVYISQKTKFTYFFDGTIILTPKEGVDIDEIIENTPEISLQKTLLGGIVFCQVEEGVHILDTANKIYESGLAKFSYPNYIPPVVSH